MQLNLDTSRFPYLYIILILGMFLNACVEEFDISTDDENSLIADKTLVVEATLTDSLQTQKIILSRAVSFENDSIVEFDETDPNSSLFLPQTSQRPIVYERNAQVSIESDTGKTLTFFEAQPGEYLSTEKFKAEEGMSYRILIRRSNGQQISSEFESLKGKAKINSLKAEKGYDSSGEEGLYFYVDGETNRQDEVAYYRYTYEETFKIVAPYWSPLDFSLRNYDAMAGTGDISIVSRDEETKTCYRTEYSEEIIQLSTENNSNNNVEKFPVFFLSRKNYALAYRYSIEVTQYLEDIDGFLYYNRLRSFSKSTSVFFQTQPGFLKGNLEVESDPESLVIGYFSVASVSKKRIFLDYNDFYEGEPQTSYLVNCRLLSSPVTSQPQCPLPVVYYVDRDVISYYGSYDELIVPNAQCPGPYIYVPKICGDCNVLGENVKPTFWLD